jgi:nucleoside-diphosphate-sugar epimerase
MASVLIAGCGDLGCKLAELLVHAGHQVTGLRRSATPLPANVQAIRSDVTQPASLQELASIKPEILVYCVAASAQSDEHYRAVYVDGLRNVLTALLPGKSLKHVFFVSSTRVYGQDSDALLNESTPAEPADFGGQRLLQAEELLKRLRGSTTTLRLSGIYGPGRTRMIKLASQPELWQAQNPWTNRIHRDDAARFIEFLIARVAKKEAVDDCYIVTDNRPAPQWNVLLWIALRLGVNTGKYQAPAVRGGKRLSNFRMRALGFTLQYKDYEAGYGEMLNAMPAQAKAVTAVFPKVR